VILVTRLNGPALAINADLIERAEATPDTVITLVDGTKYLIEESIDELVERMRFHRAAVLVRASEIERGGGAPVLGTTRALRVVPGCADES
jgi:flagellar protein FlbD